MTLLLDNQTLAFYDANAESYFQQTIKADLSETRDRFVQKIGHRPARVLDAGCGSGRDSRAFLDLGYTVDAFDGSAELATRASTFLGQDVNVLGFEDFRAKADCYNGIWACASLLHLKRALLPEIFDKFRGSLKPDGIFFSSFKLGPISDEQRIDAKGRHFTDMTPESLSQLLLDQGFGIEDIWVTTSVLPGITEKWVSALAHTRPRQVI